MRQRSTVFAVVLACGLMAAPSALGQEAAAGQAPPEPASRAAEIEQQEQAKFEHLVPAAPGKAEAVAARIFDTFLSGQLHWHPFFQNAYSGGGFTLGAGYLRYVSSYNLLDVRGSLTFSGYKRFEAQFMAPEVFNRRGTLSVLGGWREATQVNFFGLGMATTTEQKTNYGFTQPYLSAALDVFPTRKLFLVGAAVEVSQWQQGAGSGTAPSIEQKYTSQTLPGLGAQPVYLHSQGTIAL